MKKAFQVLLFSMIFISGFAQTNIKDQIDYSVPHLYRIAAIDVEGNGQIDKNIIVSYAGIGLGKEIYIPGDEITRAITNLWKQKLFSDVKIEVSKIDGEDAYLLITVKTRPRLSKYSLTGIKKSEAEKIREKISLVRGEIVTKQRLQNATNRIREFYKDKGYYNPSIDIIQEPDSLFSKNSLHLTFKINKGERIRIEQLYIAGNENVKTAKIKRLLKKTKEYKKLNIFRSSKYLEDLFEEDKQRVIQHYNSLGYRDARIVDDSVTLVKNTYIRVALYISEGNKYYFRNINFSGNTKYTNEHLSKILGIGKGDIYNPELLQKKLSMNPSGLDISSLYMDNGYLFFNVNPVEVKVENDSIDLEIRIFEGPQATINKVEISGNLRTSDHVIMREIRTRPGQKFSRSDIIRSQRELAQLGYFDPEKMNVIPTPNMEDGTVDIEYKLVEKPSDQLQLQGGWGAGQFVGSLGFMFSNFSTRKMFKPKAWHPLPSGDGQRLSIRFQSNAIYYSSFNFSFTEPWFGGKKPNSFTISAYHSQQSNGYKAGDENRQQIKISGATIGLGKRLRFPDDYFTLYNALSFQRYDLDNYTSYFAFSDGYSNNLNLQHILSRNSIDQPIYPRSGSSITLSLQYTFPYSLVNGKDYTGLTQQEKYKWMEYHKWGFKASWFLNIVDKLVLNSRLEYGFLGTYNKDIGITPFERYYVGGDGLTGYQLDGRELIKLRGYAENKITDNLTRYSDEEGGTIYSKYTMELRYPFSLNPTATIYGLAFLEAGNSWLQFKKFNPFDVYRSAGVGIRIYMPMFGLLGFDWGYGFDALENLETPDNRQYSGSQFHITIGQEF